MCCRLHTEHILYRTRTHWQGVVFAGSNVLVVLHLARIYGHFILYLTLHCHARVRFFIREAHEQNAPLGFVRNTPEVVAASVHIYGSWY